MTNERTSELHKLRTLHLFAGAGGGILADLLLGHHPVCAVEIEPYCQQVLHARQKDGILPWFPIFDDVKTFDGKPWKGLVDVVAGGFPCTDISSARTNSRINGKQRGLDGESSGLWFEMERIIGEIRPKFAFIENSPNLRTRGLVRILQGLDSMGYHTSRCVLGCSELGADHHRKRMFILAHANESQCEGGGVSGRTHKKHADAFGPDWWKDQPNLERVANGVASGLDANWKHRLKAIGNGQVPQCAAMAWRILSQ